MKYRDLHIQTQREAPNNARTEGFSFLVRAGYVTRENELTPLGKYTVAHLQNLAKDSFFIFHLSSFLPTLNTADETFFPISTGSTEIIHCPACKYTERLEQARFAKSALPVEEPRPLEKVLTPNCHTIESLANFLNLPKEKTAKALMYARPSDGKFIFVVVRGDMQLSEAKLKGQVGDVRVATFEEIENAGAAAGYASPIGLRDALIVVDDLIPQSQNLVAGANEDGYHLMNTNLGRDYQAEIITDLALAKAGDACAHCGNPLSLLACDILATRGRDVALQRLYDHNILLALAETHHDGKGLTLPSPAAPFDVYLMHLPGKMTDTRAKAEEIYNVLQDAGISVLFDDRDERAGVKFNDADLIGCPVRVTVGERGLKEGMVEVKARKAGESMNITFDAIANHIKNLLAS